MDEMGGRDPTGTTRLALLFEGGLGAAALTIGWFMGHWPAIGVASGCQAAEQIRAVGWGLVATGPLLLGLLAMDRLPFGPLRRLRKMASEVIWRMFHGASVLQLAVVSIAAGMGEELLFRGLIQGGMSRWLGGGTGDVVALVVASALFGVCHWLNATYATLAMVAGAYFGLLLLATGNILTPITAHAAYDFLALVYLIRPSKMLGSSG